MVNQVSLASTTTWLRRAARWNWIEYAFWIVPIAAYFIFPDDLALLSQMAITALFALSLDLVLGYAGIISLGQAALFGIGAYIAGLIALHGWTDPLLGLAAAAAGSAAFGFATSFLVLRGADLTRLMVTLGLALLLYAVANQYTSLTGGLDGLQGISVAPLLGRFTFGLYGRVAYIYCTVMLFLAFFVVRRLTHSPFGLSLRGLHQNARRVPALGMSVRARLVAAYTLGAALAGIAGALLTQTTQFVSIDVLSFERSADVLLMVVLGGTGTLYGAMIGAVVFMLVHNMLSNLNPQYWQFWMGAALVLVVMLARGGIVGGVRQVAQRPWWRSR